MGRFVLLAPQPTTSYLLGLCPLAPSHVHLESLYCSMGKYYRSLSLVDPSCPDSTLTSPTIRQHSFSSIRHYFWQLGSSRHRLRLPRWHNSTSAPLAGPCSLPTYHARVTHSGHSILPNRRSCLAGIVYLHNIVDSSCPIGHSIFA